MIFLFLFFCSFSGDDFSVYLLQLIGLSEADKEALALLIKAATIMDEIFYLQVVNIYTWLDS